MTLKSRRRWSLVILLIALPLYVVVAVNIVGLFDRPPLWLEAVIYVVLGIVWVLPFKRLFRGIGQADPNAEDPKDTS